ncbi:hypothetical protein LCGC14_1027100 [marine sediment metagenome]|uniref:Uncharacterized protein n=1 Tax=marine sediment metagenome TaxID=412755 RepID=A0A0F9MVQ6_9ZZZZ
MRIYLHGLGDSSVGIPPFNATVHIKGVRTGDFAEALAGGRNELRKDLEKYFSELCDDSMVAFFGDECPDCLNILDENTQCTDKDCSNYLMNFKRDKEDK